MLFPSYFRTEMPYKPLHRPNEIHHTLFHRHPAQQLRGVTWAEQVVTPKLT